MSDSFSSRAASASTAAMCLDRDPAVGDQLPARSAHGRGEWRRPDVLVDEHAGDAAGSMAAARCRRRPRPGSGRSRSRAARSPSSSRSPSSRASTAVLVLLEDEDVHDPDDPGVVEPESSSAPSPVKFWARPGIRRRGSRRAPARRASLGHDSPLWDGFAKVVHRYRLPTPPAAALDTERHGLRIKIAPSRRGSASTGVPSLTRPQPAPSSKSCDGKGPWTRRVGMGRRPRRRDLALAGPTLRVSQSRQGVVARRSGRGGRRGRRR